MAKAKTKSKTMTHEILDRLDHIENVLESHANCGIRNDNQIAALEEAICPRVAARLTALERQQKQLTEQIEMFKKAPEATQTPAFTGVARRDDTALATALAHTFGWHLGPKGVQALRHLIAEFS